MDREAARKGLLPLRQAYQSSFRRTWIATCASICDRKVQRYRARARAREREREREGGARGREMVLARTRSRTRLRFP